MPRSPSRDRSDRFAGRRGYFRRLVPLDRLKVMLTVVAATFATGWMAVDSLWPKQTQEAHTHGELADPHASLGDRCEACHRPFSGGDASPFAAGGRWRDFNCKECHTGGTHHAPPGSADANAHADCGSCHHDHRGRSSLLARVSDTHCTACHADLSKHPSADPHAPPVHTPITHFVTGHPRFRGLEQEPPRTLKFSHALHMTPGLSYVEDGGEALTPTRVKELYGQAGAARYTAFENGKLLLNCRDCHQPDAGGKHHTPVSYETSCKTCHPTQVPSGVAGGKEVKRFSIPHGKQWTETKEEVQAGYLKQLIREDRLPLPTPDGPGGRTDREREKQAELIREEVMRLSKSAMAGLLGSEGCAKCHDTTGTEVASTPARTRWLSLADFNHASHLGGKPLESCKNCHPGTIGRFAPDGRPPEKESLKDNVAGIDSCRTCHAPKGSSPTAGVRHGCTDCHSYHRR